MRYLIILFSTVLTFLFTSQVKAEEMVSVKLVNHIGESSSIDFNFEGEYFSLSPTVQLQEGVNYTLSVKKKSFVLQGGGETLKLSNSLVLIPKHYNYDHIVRINDRPYLGAFEFTIENKQYVRPINQLPMEDYLKGVVPFEVFPSWELETLKAQTLAARTYAVTHMSDDNMDDTIRYQVYGGFTWNEATTKAVEETEGEVIAYNGRLIDAFYSASNGGITESNAHVWGGKPLSYFPIKKDPYDPTHPWKFSLVQEQINTDEIDWEDENWWDNLNEKDTEITSSMKNWLSKNGYPGDHKILSINNFELSNGQLKSKRSIKGSIQVEFLHRLFEGTVLYRQLTLDQVNLNRIRPMIGGNLFKSYLIESLEFDDGVYTMKGKGYGHGVGMSQWGAQVMGEQGNTYDEILDFYYPGTEIERISKK